MNPTLLTIHSLATTHGAFTDRSVNPGDLEAVIQASLRAATASARQSYSLVVVEDTPTIRKLCGYAGAAGIVYCVDYNRLLDTSARLGEKYEVNGFMDFITGSTDTILAAESGAVAAKSLGLDYMFTNGIHRGNLNRVYDILGLPEKYCVPLIMLVLGYAEHSPIPRGRLGGDGVVHRGRYARISGERADEIVRIYDDKDNRLGLADDWRSKGYEHYIEWFCREWTHTDPRQAEAFEQLLRRQGFLG